MELRHVGNGWLDRSSLLDVLVDAVIPEKAGNILLAGPWGSGKTALLRDLEMHVKQSVDCAKVHPIWFSPAEAVVEGDVRNAFLHLLRNELKRLAQGCSGVDGNFVKQAKRWIEILNKALNSKLAGRLAKFVPLGEALLAPSGEFFAFLSAIVETLPDEDQRKDGRIGALRNQIGDLLTGIARAHGKERILLLVDDLDRTRPDQAAIALDSLHQLFLPQENDRNDGWPLSSVWAINTTVLEEVLYREYRELPSFDSNAYLEKIFARRVNVPPLFQINASGDAERLWRADLEPYCSQFAQYRMLVPDLSRRLGDEVNYAILGNLRLHARVRRDCIRLWGERLDLPEKSGDSAMTVDRLIREARLIAVTDAFPHFREKVGPYNGMWSDFLNQVNNRVKIGSSHRVGNPLQRHVESPDLATLLEDLGVLQFDPAKGCYQIDEEGRTRFQRDLNKLWKRGV